MLHYLILIMKFQNLIVKYVKDPCDNTCKKVPLITKTKENLTEVQRYSNAVKYKTYSKI